MSLTAEEILPFLDFPRENATTGLEQGHAVLDSLLQSAQLAPSTEPFAASPFRLLAVGMCLAMVLLGLVAGIANRQLRWRLMVLLGCGLALVFAAGGFDALLPHTPTGNLLVEIAPSGPERRTVMLSAHYDSKTELFDHAVRGVVVLAVALTLPVAVYALFRTRNRKRRAALVLPAVLALLLACLQTLATPLLPKRSHGICDNAAACALLVELCSRAAHRPLEHTRLQFAWWSAEEIGAQGSDIWVQRNPTALPDYLINFEAIGCGPDLAIANLEWTGRWWTRPSDELTQLFEAVRGQPLRRLSTPLLSDAGPFLGMGGRAITVLNLPANARWPRSLHSKSDRLEALQASGLDATRTLLLQSLRSLDELPTDTDR